MFHISITMSIANCGDCRSETQHTNKRAHGSQLSLEAIIADYKESKDQNQKCTDALLADI